MAVPVGTVAGTSVRVELLPLVQFAVAATYEICARTGLGIAHNKTNRSVRSFFNLGSYRRREEAIIPACDGQIALRCRTGDHKSGRRETLDWVEISTE